MDDEYVIASRDQLAEARARLAAARRLPWWRRWLAVLDAEAELSEVQRRILGGL
jgi:hypothetical protein